MGYRARKTKQVIEFRKWVTKILREHIMNGYTINESRIRMMKREQLMNKIFTDIEKTLPQGVNLQTSDVLELVRLFSGTWFSLDAYDKSNLPKSGLNKNKCCLLQRSYKLL